MIVERIYNDGKWVSERREYRTQAGAISAATQLLHRGWYVDTAYPRLSFDENSWYLICRRKWDQKVTPLR